MPLSTTVYGWLLFAHVLAAMLWLGGLCALVVLATRALRAGDAAVADLLGQMRVLGPAILAPGSIGVAVFGAWLVARSPVWDVDQGWVRLGIALLALAAVVGIGLGARTAIGAQKALDGGDPVAARRQLRRWSWAIRLVLALLVVATWDMTVKPGL